MKYILISIITLFFAEKIFANCELGWVSSWESNINWIHTSALYPKEFDEAYVYSKKIKQIEISKDDNTINFQCETAEVASCEKITSLKFKGSSCKIDQNSTTFSEGITNEGVVGVTIDIYAKSHIKNCLKKTDNSDIALLNDNKILTISRRYPLLEQGVKPAEIFLKENLRKIIQLEELTTIQFSERTTLNFQKGDFNAVNMHKDSLGNIILHINAKISKSESGDLCSRCSSNYEKKNIPILIGYFNKKWLFIGNGRMGDCTDYFDNMQDSNDWEKLDIPFGLPSEYVTYDTNNDNIIDIFSLTPREQLPGTKEIYLLSNEKIISIGELCAMSGECRPEPGC